MDDWIQETSPPSRAMALQPLPQSTQTQSHPHSFSARSIQPHPSSTAREPHPQPCSSSRTKDHLPQQPPAKKSRFSALTEQELEELSKPCVPKNTESSTKLLEDTKSQWRAISSSITAAITIRPSETHEEQIRISAGYIKQWIMCTASSELKVLEHNDAIQENRLWESGVLGVDDPTKLLRAVFLLERW